MSNASPQRFLQAAGGRGPIRVLVSSGTSGPGKLFEFAQPSVLVGSRHRADLLLNHPEVSGRQLYLQLIDGRLFGVNLSTRAPTFWDAEARPSGWIERGTILHMGPFDLRFPDAEETHAEPALGNPLTSASFAGPAVSLEMENAGARATLNRQITLVGTLPICKVRIHHSSISSIHCSLVRAGEGLWMVDLGSREGVQVNGVVVRAALLADGDVLDLGSRRLRVRFEHSEAISPGAAPPEVSSFGPTELVARGGQSLPPLLATIEAGELLNALGPVLDRLAGSEAQKFEQFRDMMGLMIQAFGAMFNEHREFVKDEMARFDQLALALANKLEQPTAPAPAARDERSGRPSTGTALDLSFRLPPLDRKLDDSQIHAWLQQRIQDVGDDRATLWKKMAGFFRGTAPEGARESPPAAVTTPDSA